jgi:prolipoprotein diacylglyceryl transferase
VLLLPTIPPPPFQNLELGPLVLHGYGLCIGIAIVLSLTLVDRVLRAQHVATDRLQSVVIPAVVMGFVGARLYHVASSPQRFLDHPADIVKVWHGGLGIYGAVLFGAVTALAISPRFGIPRGALADAAAPALLLAQAFGRIGNYLNQELFGTPTDRPWGLEVDLDRRPVGMEQETTFHPTFLYESVCNLVLLGVFLVLLRRWRTRAPGVLFALYVAGYSCVRLFTEQFRTDPVHSFHGIRQNAYVAGALIAIGLTTALVMQLRHRRSLQGGGAGPDRGDGGDGPGGPGAAPAMTSSTPATPDPA